jgi:oxygen-independent coproporphyrinogen-3 oxidase
MSSSTIFAPPVSPPAGSNRLSQSLLQRFDTPGPRYTSYPTADRFGPGFGSAAAVRALHALSHRCAPAGATGPEPLSVYVHVPFCESVCYYCACNKVVTKHHERATEYLDALDDEIALVTGVLGAGRPMSQLHFGGGSPTFLSDAELRHVVATLRRAFRLTADAEVSIEIDPRTVTPARLGHLRELGFNRVSFGVQDFDPEVQKAVHRVQPHDSVEALMTSARMLGFDSINADLIYGLPCQTRESFARTVQQIGALRPDRIALYAYAHLPQRFKPQRRIHADQLPSAAQRVEMLGDAIAGFTQRGYDDIGMDHFALHDDALAVAKRAGRLHRNFQGYSTQPDCDLIGLGVSAISRVGESQYQNAKSLPEYHDMLRARTLPVVRGIVSSADDLVRREVIMALMCQGRVAFAPIERRLEALAAHAPQGSQSPRMRDHFAAEFERLQPLAQAGLVVLEPEAIQVTEAGWVLVRAVAMVFDAHLRRDIPLERFSRIV